MLSKPFALSLLASFCLAAATPLEKRADTAGYQNPADHGGSMQAWYSSGSLIDVSRSYPLNVCSHFHAQLRPDNRSVWYALHSLQVIVSGLSTPSVLTNNGMMDWMRYTAVLLVSRFSNLLHWHYSSLGYSTSGYSLTPTNFGRFNGIRGNTGDGKGTIPAFSQFEIRCESFTKCPQRHTQGNLIVTKCINHTKCLVDAFNAYRGYVWKQRSTGAYFLAAYHQVVLDLPDQGK